MTDEPSNLTNAEAEAAIIGVMMQDRRWIEPLVDKMRPEDFSINVLGRIFATIASEASLGRYMTPVTLKSHYQDDEGLKQLGGIPFLAKLTGDSSSMAMDVLGVADVLIDLAKRREINEGLLEAAQSCHDLSRTTAEIISQVDSAISTRADSAIVESDSAETMQAFFLQMEDGDVGVTCERIPSLDEILGKLKPKSLNILAGRPGMGKSAVVSSYALGAAEAGHGVLFVSLEMSREELAGRQLADWGFDDERSRILYSNIESGELNGWQRAKLLELSGEIAKLPLTIIDAGSLTVGRLDMLVRRHKRRMAAKGVSLDLVIVDYLQLLHADRKGLGAYEATTEVSKRLKGIAKDHAVSVMALAQLNRSVEQRPDKRPMLADLRDSGQIEQDADSITFLLREEYYLRQSEPQDDPEKHARWEADIERVRGVIEFIVAKKRKGQTGSRFGRFFGPYQAVRG